MVMIEGWRLLGWFLVELSRAVPLSCVEAVNGLVAAVEAD